MLYIKMSCGNCGNDFEIYSQEMNNRDRPIRCPHCLRQMPDRHWKNLINVYFAASDWNREVLKSHIEHGEPLFKAEFTSKNVPLEMIREGLELYE